MDRKRFPTLQSYTALKFRRIYAFKLPVERKKPNNMMNTSFTYLKATIADTQHGKSGFCLRRGLSALWSASCTRVMILSIASPFFQTFVSPPQTMEVYRSGTIQWSCSCTNQQPSPIHILPSNIAAIQCSLVRLPTRVIFSLIFRRIAISPIQSGCDGSCSEDFNGRRA